MIKQTQIFTLSVVVICMLTATVFAEVSTTTGTISEVTVYRGQALEPNSVEQDAAIVKYSYTMEYDKNMQIQPRK